MEVMLHSKVMQAYQSYHQHVTYVEPWGDFWAFLGKRGYYRVNGPSWEVTAEVARKIDMLCSPYAEILLKAWKYQHGSIGMRVKITPAELRKAFDAWQHQGNRGGWSTFMEVISAGVRHISYDNVARVYYGYPITLERIRCIISPHWYALSKAAEIRRRSAQKKPKAARGKK